MTEREARELLLMHSCAHHDLQHPKMTSGFLGSLRPYTGLNQDNFHEMMHALRVLAPRFGEEKIERQIISALWGTCHLSRAWGVHPDGMLKSNDLITEEESQQLEQWIETISYAVMMLLDGDEEEAFRDYTA